MTSPAAGPPESASPASSWRARLAPVYRWLVRYFLWHVWFFVSANLILNGLNFLTGRPWWAFWPLLVTSPLLAAHYLFYKTATVDERWADARTEELNLKSYDRGHIEDIKSRFEKGEVPPPPPR
ncbi:2TM domain-containing protein [Bradyrhizobium icense]|nr:2TM domain-containing protein [Bradyrhizobium icense]